MQGPRLDFEGATLGTGVARCHYAAAMMPGREKEVWRTKDGRAWRVGLDAEIAWIGENTETGLGITSAIPPLFAAYATLELPGTGEHDPASWFEDPDRHAAGVLAVWASTRRHSPGGWGIWKPGLAPKRSSTTCPR